MCPSSVAPTNNLVVPTNNLVAHTNTLVVPKDIIADQVNSGTFPLTELGLRLLYLGIIGTSIIAGIICNTFQTY